LSVVAGRRELCRLRNEIAAAEFEWPKDCRGFNMSRSVLAVSAALLAAALPTHANAQTGTHNFSGLCAFYPAHGNGLTAAHRTLPFGTRVRVTDPKTGRTVTVTVNDRGPFGRHRVLDLSPSAARALGMMSRGVIFVQAEVL
jgi:rare lipoprotein A